MTTRAPRPPASRGEPSRAGRTTRAAGRTQSTRTTQPTRANQANQATQATQATRSRQGAPNRSGGSGRATRPAPAGPRRTTAAPRQPSYRTPPHARRPAPVRRPPRRPEPLELRLADSHRRLRGAVVGLLVLLSLFAARLVQMQGLDAAAYADEAAAGRLRTQVLPAVRGTITDRNGVALATSVDAVDVTVDQTKVSQPGAEAAVLAPVLGIDAATLQERLTGTRRFAYLAKKVTPRQWHQVLDLNLPDTEGLPGIFGVKTSKRVYPGGQTGANIVGFLQNDAKKSAGLEGALNPVLAGRDGKATYELSAGGRRIPGADDSERAAVPGHDVRLTIDRDIQYVAQKAVAKAVKVTGSQSGTVIVMDPRSGELLAMATAPTFDPNHPADTPLADRGNRPVEESYEPGSTGKVITASALLEQHKITPKTPITVPNRYCRAGKCFKDFEDHGTEHLTYAGTIAKSSNIGTIRAAERMGNLKKLYPFLDKFGIGHPTGLDLPGETSGVLPKPKTWSATSGYTMVFGQGYSVNTVQMASVFATIADNGVRVAPRLIAGTTGASGTFAPAPQSGRTRVISTGTARTVRSMLERVTMDGGTAPLAAIPGYRVGGKTGTAQRYNPACHCYRGYTMSFIGMAPVDKPALVVAVTLQAPKSAIGGGVNAGPVFNQVMSFALEAERVPPTGTKPPKMRLFAH
jgi:cell division protein FtsI (penicillin-binding protein 3)